MSITCLIILIYCSINNSFGQEKQSLYLIFNTDSSTSSNVHSLNEILGADSIHLNIEEYEIVKFICSSVCSVDWQYETRSNKLTESLKSRIKGCARPGSRIYFKIYYTDEIGIMNVVEISIKIKK